MRSLAWLLAAALVATSVAPSAAANVDRSHLRGSLIQIIKRINTWTPPRTSTETVSCTGADGTTVAFSTSTARDRQLTSAVRVRIAGQTTVVPAVLMTTYANADAGIAMKAFRPLSTAELLTFVAELVPTVAPQTDEVATYRGTVSVNGAAERHVTCSAFRQGAGLLKPQLVAGGANIEMACYRPGETAGPALVSFSVARNPSQRLISDLQEVRSATDSETLPSFLVSQYSLGKSALVVELDDGSADGNVLARLSASGQRVPGNQPVADPAIYGIWSGTYERFDAGRELNEAVTCYAL